MNPKERILDNDFMYGTEMKIFLNYQNKKTEDNDDK